MKNTTEKRTQAITINLTEEEARELLALAQSLQRKPAELARLVLVPAVRQYWAKCQPLGAFTVPQFPNN